MAIQIETSTYTEFDTKILLPNLFGNVFDPPDAEGSLHLKVMSDEMLGHIMERTDSWWHRAGLTGKILVQLGQEQDENRGLDRNTRETVRTIYEERFCPVYRIDFYSPEEGPHTIATGGNFESPAKVNHEWKMTAGGKFFFERAEQQYYAVSMGQSEEGSSHVKVVLQGEYGKTKAKRVPTFPIAVDFSPGTFSYKGQEYSLSADVVAKLWVAEILDVPLELAFLMGNPMILFPDPYPTYFPKDLNPKKYLEGLKAYYNVNPADRVRIVEDQILDLVRFLVIRGEDYADPVTLEEIEKYVNEEMGLPYDKLKINKSVSKGGVSFTHHYLRYNRNILTPAEQEEWADPIVCFQYVGYPPLPPRPDI